MHKKYGTANKIRQLKAMFERNAEAEMPWMLTCCLILLIYSADAGAKVNMNFQHVNLKFKFLISFTFQRNYAILLDRVNYTIHQPGLTAGERFECVKNIIGLNTFTLHLKIEQNITNFQIRDNINILRETKLLQR